MRFQGKLTNWNDAKGIGTITWNGSSDRVFVHISAFTTRRKRPAEGDIVTYEVEKGKNGKFKAVNVSFPQSRLPSARERSRSGGSVFIGSVLLIFLVYLLFAVFTGRVRLFVLGIYAVASIVAFLAYCIDKDAAGQGEWRIQESTLHMFALFYGWPGAFLAQRIVRHKTKKEEFQRVFIATVLINVVGFCVYSSPFASKTLLTFLS
ncbi:MAG: cold shock and DUF1294 domain-containing protein [Gammaproteobacteria bacterium]|nr:cold shock and DUF1294 domain-containing protein [Gammaproteobacteria bacterium]